MYIYQVYMQVIYLLLHMYIMLYDYCTCTQIHTMCCSVNNQYSTCIISLIQQLFPLYFIQEIIYIYQVIFCAVVIYLQIMLTHSVTYCTSNSQTVYICLLLSIYTCTCTEAQRTAKSAPLAQQQRLSSRLTESVKHVKRLRGYMQVITVSSV